MRVPTLSSLRRTAGRTAVAVVAAAGLTALSVPVADAATPTAMACTGGGTVTIDKKLDGTYSWLLNGIGSCTTATTPARIRQVTLVGTATTPNLGLCSNSPLVDAFAMKVTATFVSLDPVRGAITTLQNQVWSLPASTFPIVTAFGITDPAGEVLGAGEFETHIFAKCPPDGQPTMQVNWVQAA